MRFVSYSSLVNISVHSPPTGAGCVALPPLLGSSATTQHNPGAQSAGRAEPEPHASGVTCAPVVSAIQPRSAWPLPKYVLTPITRAPTCASACAATSRFADTGIVAALTSSCCVVSVTSMTIGRLFARNPRPPIAPVSSPAGDGVGYAVAASNGGTMPVPVSGDGYVMPTPVATWRSASQPCSGSSPPRMPANHGPSPSVMMFLYVIAPTSDARPAGVFAVIARCTR